MRCDQRQTYLPEDKILGINARRTMLAFLIHKVLQTANWQRFDENFDPENRFIALDETIQSQSPSRGFLRSPTHVG